MVPGDRFNTYIRPLCHYLRDNTEHRKFLNNHRGLFLPNDSFPPVEHRLNLLDNFIQAHTWYFEKTLHYVMRYLRLEETFDFSKTYCHVTVRYREDCGGNPSLAFRVDDMEFRALADAKVYPIAAKSIEAGRLTDEFHEARGRESDPDFIGVMTVAWMMEDYCSWKRWVYSRMLPDFKMYQDNLERRIQDRWLEDFQNLVLKGLTYKNPEEGKLWRLGTLKKRGEKWYWEQLTPDELEDMGYARRHGLGY